MLVPVYAHAQVINITMLQLKLVLLVILLVQLVGEPAHSNVSLASQDMIMTTKEIHARILTHVGMVSKSYGKHVMMEI